MPNYCENGLSSVVSSARDDAYFAEMYSYHPAGESGEQLAGRGSAGTVTPTSLSSPGAPNIEVDYTYDNAGRCARLSDDL